MADLRTDDFEFDVAPVIITDQGAEMKRRICVSVSVVDPDTGKPLMHSTAFEDALVRIQQALFGGELEVNYWKAEAQSNGDPVLVWMANFDRDRLGVHPDLERVARNVPEDCENVHTLFYRFEGDDLVDASEGENEKDAA